MLAGAVGVAVTGQVDGEQRPTEGQRDRVPRVRVLRAAVEEHELRLTAPPSQRAERSTDLDLDPLPRHDGRTVERQPVLGGVLVEVRELVVGDALDHGVAPTPALGDRGPGEVAQVVTHWSQTAGG